MWQGSLENEAILDLLGPLAKGVLSVRKVVLEAPV